MPPLNNGLQGRGVDVVVLVPALTSGDDQASRLKYGQVLGDRLTRGVQSMPGRQPDAQLEQGLAAPFLELIENEPSRWVRKSLEDIAHRTEL